MAQYFWKAESGDAGGLPSNATVTQPWSSFNSLTVEASAAHADFPYALRASHIDSIISDRRAAAFSEIDGNALDQSGVTEMYAVYALNNYYTVGGVMGRISGSSGSEYGVGSRGDTVVLTLTQYTGRPFYGKLCDLYPEATPALAAVRLRFDGSNVKFRIWSYGDAEPGTWDCDETTSVTGDGDWGLYAKRTQQEDYLELMALGFGTDGDPAPTSPVYTPGVGVIETGSLAVTVTAEMRVTPPVGASVLDGTVPDLGYALGPSVGELSVVGYTPGVDTRVWFADGEAPDGWIQDGTGPDGWSADAAAGTSWTPS